LPERALDAALMVGITGTPEEQIEWGEKAIGEAAELGQEKRLGALWNNLGATYEDLGKYKKALPAYQKARDYHRKFGTEVQKMIADYAVAHAYRLTRDFEQARKWLPPVLEWAEKLGESEFVGLTCRELGELEFYTGNKAAALPYYLRADSLLTAAGMADWDAKGYKLVKKRITEVQDFLDK